MNWNTTIDARELVESRPIGRLQYVGFAIVFLVAMLDGLDTQILGYVAPALAKSWHLSPAEVGSAFSIGLVGVMLGSLSLGVLGDAIGPKRVLVGVTLLVGVATLLTSCAGSIEQLRIFRFLTGFGVGGALPNTIAIASQLAPDRRRATWITLIGCGFPLGATVAGVVAASTLASGGWRLAYQTAGVLPIVMVPFLARYLPESIPALLRRRGGQEQANRVLQRMYADHRPATVVWSGGSETSNRMPLKALFERQRLTTSLLLAPLFFMSLLVLYFMANWLPSLLQELGFSPKQAVVATTGFNLAGLIGSPILGVMVDRVGFRRVLILSYLSGAFCVTALALATHNPTVMVVLTAIAGFVLIGSQGSLNALPASLYEDDLRAAATGWALGTGRLGSVAGPLIAGYLLAAQYSHAQVMMMSTVPTICAAGLAFLIVTLHHRRAAGSRARKGPLSVRA